MSLITTVLIVEDDLSLQNLYKMILGASGFSIIGTANNGEEAVKLFMKLEEKPDIILMDHRMPIKNGLEATIEILKISKHPKIIFASADRTIKEKALSIGAVYFLEKPFGVEQLITVIKKSNKNHININC